MKKNRLLSIFAMGFLSTTVVNADLNQNEMDIFESHINALEYDPDNKNSLSRVEELYNKAGPYQIEILSYVTKGNILKDISNRIESKKRTQSSNAPQSIQYTSNQSNNLFGNDLPFKQGQNSAFSNLKPFIPSYISSSQINYEQKFNPTGVYQRQGELNRRDNVENRQPVRQNQQLQSQWVLLPQFAEKQNYPASPQLQSLNQFDNQSLQYALNQSFQKHSDLTESQVNKDWEEKLQEGSTGPLVELLHDSLRIIENANFASSISLLESSLLYVKGFLKNYPKGNNVIGGDYAKEMQKKIQGELNRRDNVENRQPVSQNQQLQSQWVLLPQFAGKQNYPVSPQLQSLNQFDNQLFSSSNSVKSVQIIPQGSSQWTPLDQQKPALNQSVVVQSKKLLNQEDYKQANLLLGSIYEGVGKDDPDTLKKFFNLHNSTNFNQKTVLATNYPESMKIVQKDFQSLSNQSVNENQVRAQYAPVDNRPINTIKELKSLPFSVPVDCPAYKKWYTDKEWTELVSKKLHVRARIIATMLDKIILHNDLNFATKELDNIVEKLGKTKEGIKITNDLIDHAIIKRLGADLIKIEAYKKASALRNFCIENGLEKKDMVRLLPLNDDLNVMSFKKYTSHLLNYLFNKIYSTKNGTKSSIADFLIENFESQISGTEVLKVILQKTTPYTNLVKAFDQVVPYSQFRQNEDTEDKNLILSNLFNEYTWFDHSMSYENSEAKKNMTTIINNAMINFINSKIVQNVYTEKDWTDLMGQNIEVKNILRSLNIDPIANLRKSAANTNKLDQNQKSFPIESERFISTEINKKKFIDLNDQNFIQVKSRVNDLF